MARDSKPLNPDDVARMVMLTYGRQQDGKSPYWCYVAVKPSEYERFMAALKNGSLDLHSFNEDGYGEVLVSGPGLYPPIDVTREVARTFRMPIKDLFGEVDPRAAIRKKIEELKKKVESTGQAS